MYRLLLSLFLVCFSAFTCADDFSSQDFGDYRVHYSTFNSMLVTPDIAKIHKLTRANNKNYINVALTRKEAGSDMYTLGLPATVTGQARNLLGQSQTLNFQKIEEGEVVYFLALVEFDDEEIFHIDIQVKPLEEKRRFDVTFTRKFYFEEP